MALVTDNKHSGDDPTFECNRLFIKSGECCFGLVKLVMAFQAAKFTADSIPCHLKQGFLNGIKVICLRDSVAQTVRLTLCNFVKLTNHTCFPDSMLLIVIV